MRAMREEWNVMMKHTLAKKAVSLLATGALALSLVPSLAFADTTATAGEKQDAYNTIVEAMSLTSDQLKEEVQWAVYQASLKLDRADYNDNTDAYIFATEIRLKVAEQSSEINDQLYEEFAEYYQRAITAEASLAEAQAEAKASAKEAKAAQQELKTANKEIKTLSEQLAKAQTSVAAADKILIKSVKVSNLTASGGSGKASLTWKVANAIDGLKYQVKYRKSGTSAWSKKKSKKTSCSVTGLKANTNYQFKVRAFKKISGKKVFTSFTAISVAKVLQAYKAGDYKVNDTSGANVRPSASTSKTPITALRYGQKVAVSKIVTASDGTLWGKVQVKVGNETKTGYVLMSLLKAV